MSTAVMTACWPLQMPPSQKAVLISLADNAGDDGECTISVATLCKRTCLSRATVLRCIEWLERAGRLSAKRRFGARSTYSISPAGDLFTPEPVSPRNRYHHETGRKVRQVGGDTGSKVQPVAAKVSPKPVSLCDPEQKQDLNQKQDQKLEQSARASRLPNNWQPANSELEWAEQERPDVDARAEADKFRDYWRAVPGAKGRKLDWPATWRNWIRNARGTPSVNATRTSTAKPSLMQRAEADLADYIARARA